MELFLILLAVGIGFTLFLTVAFFLMCYFVWSNPLREGGPLFFVKAKQNTIMHIMEGDTFSEKYILLSKTETILSDGKIDNHPPRKKNRNILGMVWIGIPGVYKIHKRHQQWMEWESTEKGRVIRFRDEHTPFLLTKPFEYAMKLTEAEDKNNMPLDITFTVILKPINAYKPIFGNDDAYGQVQTLCLGYTLLFVREKTLSNLGTENTPDKVDQDEFSSLIIDLNRKIPGRTDGLGIKEILGYEILDAKINSIEISGENKEILLDASTKVYIAQQEKEARVIAGSAQKEYDFEIAKGEEARLKVKENFYRSIAYLPGAMDAEKLSKVPNLTTYVEGDGNGKTKIVLPSPENNNHKK